MPTASSSRVTGKLRGRPGAPFRSSKCPITPLSVLDGRWRMNSSPMSSKPATTASLRSRLSLTSGPPPGPRRVPIDRLGPPGSLHPLRAIRPDLLLPDRDFGLQAVDRVLARLEGELPVRRAHGDDDARLADAEPADPVGHRHPLDAPAPAHLLRDLGH